MTTGRDERELERDAEREAVVETLVEAASAAINDTNNWSQRESADMWGDLASQARNWQSTIRAEMDADDDGEDDDGGDG